MSQEHVDKIAPAFPGGRQHLWKCIARVMLGGAVGWDDEAAGKYWERQKSGMKVQQHARNGDGKAAHRSDERDEC